MYSGTNNVVGYMYVHVCIHTHVYTMYSLAAAGNYCMWAVDLSLCTCTIQCLLGRGGGDEFQVQLHVVVW